MSTVGRLVIKHNVDVKLVIDPNGNLLVKGDRRTSSDGHGGLVFKSSGKATPSVSIKESSNIKEDGVFVADFTDSDTGTIPGGAGPALVFARNGVNQAEFTYDAAESGGPRVKAKFISNFATRKNAAKMETIERDNLRDAIIALDSDPFVHPGTFEETDAADPFPRGGVSYWDKQDEIHQSTHVHLGPAFVPWHRELVNRFEARLREAAPTVSMHYWDWTTDPRHSPDGQGGFTNLFSTGANGFMGNASGRAGAPFDTLDNAGILAGSRDEFPNEDEDGEPHPQHNPATPPQEITRDVGAGSPTIPSDASIVTTGDGLPIEEQWPAFRENLEQAHGSDAHLYIGGDIAFGHSAFEDPFVFLLHSNVERLWASWQLKPGKAWRVDPWQAYGTESDTGGDDGIATPLEPWAGIDEDVPATRPWAPPENEQAAKNSKHLSIVASPPLYDEYV